MREYIFNLLNSNNYKVFPPGKLQCPVDFSYIVIKFGEDSLASNKAGSFQLVELLCYVPDTSISQLDNMINEVKSILIKSNIADEFNGIGGEYHDATLNAYMRNLRFRIPHTTN